MVKITEDTTLEEVLNFEKAHEVLVKFNVPCLSCPFASQEMGTLTLKDITNAYGIDLKKLLKELNKKIN
ncbi:disulfide oxidoreductase [Candidatus Woesearchaeota archaeon]|nr:disulfide oxidoreductase [Candidatus Woesearchaeota archaeon]